jgi:hypothetical protein
MSERVQRGARAKRGTAAKMRARPMPVWLMEQQDLDEMARRRCLMVLRVLSGEQPVSEAIAEARISRGTYYKIETAALKAMLAAVAPGAPTEITAAADGAQRRIADLEQKVKKLEQERRRSERLLLMTRKLVKPGPMKTGAGRPPASRKRSGSTKAGRSSSSSSRTSPTSVVPSIHRKDGAEEPSGGIAS